MHRRTLIAKLATVGASCGALLMLRTPTVKAEVGNFGALTSLADSIPNVDQSPLSHRDALNSLLVGLGSVERPVPPFPSDTRIPIPEFNPDDPSDFYNAVRRALIVGGIGKDSD